VATRNSEGISVAGLAAERGFTSQIPVSARPKSYGSVSRFLRRLTRSRSPF
jgi:hypothetical protein